MSTRLTGLPTTHNDTRCQYYAHREKMRLIGREDELEHINRKALQIARQVADETGTLMAGNLCNTTIYAPNDEARAAVQQIFKVCLTDYQNI